MTRLLTIVAILGSVSLAFADSGGPAHRIVPGARIAAPRVVGDSNPSIPSGDMSPRSANEALVAPPPNDTCGGAVALTLNRRTKGSTVGAHDDYHSPATAACFPGNQFPTNSTGRDVVFSFTAPAAGRYSFKSLQLDPTVPLSTQNTAFYLTDDCSNAGTLSCLAGANHSISSTFTSSLGGSDNRGDMIECFPMTAGQTVFVVYDDGIAGRCSDDNHQCFDDSNCDAGFVCNPQINPGTDFGFEVKPCNQESEPNDTPAQANAYVCDMVGHSTVAPVAHCYLGPRAGNVCTRSTFLDQSLPDRNMRCAVSGARCVVDVTVGTDDCAAGTGPCHSLTDLDCDPRCDVGPRAGRSCTTQEFCNPVSDQGATCGGTCQVENTCIVTATGADTGVACTPACVGGLAPGRYCSALSGCPGGGVCTQTVLVPNPGGTCVAGQTCGRQFNEGDTDYYSIGSPVAGSKVFAGVDAIMSNDFDFRMRITTSTNTLQMDDDDVTTFFGQNAPTIAGAVTDGTPTFIQVSRTVARASGPYELYAIVRPPLAAAQLEDESGPTGNDLYFGWPGDVINANPVNNGASNGYVRGTFAFQGDTDCFKFLVNEGDLMDWYGDANPTRANIPVSGVDIPQPRLYDADGAGIQYFIFAANPRKNTAPNVQGPGLRALTPAVTSSYLQWRASYTGMLEVCFYGASAPLGQGTPNHPNSWAGSLSVNCGPVQAAGLGTTTADVSVTKTGPAGLVPTGGFITYTITVTNNSNQIAQEVDLQDTLDPNLTFLSLQIDDGFGGNNTACFSVPTGGANDLPIDCINTSMAPGTSTVYTIRAQVNNCIDVASISNTATIVTNSTDPDPSNDSATHTFAVLPAANNGCTPLFCSLDAQNNIICVADNCRVNAQCDAGACVSDPRSCNDGSFCTDDSCDPSVPGGCVFDPTPGNLCDDFDPCTRNGCDPVLFCVYPPEPPTTSCDDGLPCTNSDHCDGQGGCVGTSVCDDNNPCTDDFADEGNSCACSHAPSFAGTACDDGDSCTGTIVVPDACDGAGHCVGGPEVSCDDGNACTTDSCHAFLGCFNVAINCDDFNACNGVESCNPATGCVSGTPVVCAAPDQCHQAGVCQPGSGTCTYANKADGTTCDDGNSGTTNDVCTGGICAGSAACGTQPKPKSAGYYKKLCKNGQSHPYHGDELTAADAQCVGQLTSTFAGVSTVPELCAVLDHDSSGVHHDSNGPLGKECTKAEAELMALALNICRGYVCESQEVDSGCSGHDSHLNHTLTTVGASLATVDSILSDPNRNKDTCKDAGCLAKEINNGKGIHHISLSLLKEPGTGNKLRLNWDNPVMDDGSGVANSYTVWRRPILANQAFTQVAVTNNNTWVDNTAGTGTWEYEVTFTIQP